MADDDAYAAFLDKANQDPSAGNNKPASSSGAAAAASSTKNHQQNVPKSLVAATQDQFYISESDEPFEAVALPLEGDSLPDEDTFLKLTGLPYAPASVSILDPYDWDTRGQYKALLDAVRTAGQGNDVRVYRVQQDSTRAQYWLVTTTNGGQLVGVKAKSVES
ncbi:Nuclease A inhibitor-like protein [Niveomyces insectorum RCEF 264]|uniref:Nuclease A inhibitor-like protein n=1 Tax=Niveomyces insectorum RCEF 264 TaxID=1081102 RepID=A0A167Z7F1_9HYPO|nr:Nuclease A inhibitor-like protein [Niveomyces insectorum RCEF 264]